MERLRAAVESTRTERVAGSIGDFAGLFALDDDRLLAATTDGVGTKLVLSRRAGRLFDAGVDLAAHCANDLLTVGAEPLFFLDYVASSALDLAEVAELVAGAASRLPRGRLRDPRRRDGRAPGDLPRRRARLRRNDGRARGQGRPRGRLALQCRRRRARASLERPARERLHARPAPPRRRRVRRRPPAPAHAALPRGRAAAARRMRRPGARPRDGRGHSRKPPASPPGGARRTPRSRELGAARRSSPGWTSAACRRTSSGGSSTSASGSVWSCRPRMPRERGFR